MTVKELYKFLDSRIPSALSCEWDNDGLMLCPEPDREVRRVLLALDATAEVADAAIEGGFDLIVTHHPMIMKGLKAINDENYISEKAIKLIRAGVSVFSFHTRLDALEGGVNDSFASLLGLSAVEPLEHNGEKIGRIGMLPSPMNPEDFARKVKEALGAPYVLLGNAGRPALRVALLGGSGEDEVGAAIAAGADTYVSGTLKYHSLTDAREIGINLCEAGHFYTENHVCEVIREMVLSIDDSITCDIVSESNITII